MYLRFMVIAGALLLAPFSSSGGNVPDRQESALAAAAAQMKLKNYSAAYNLAADTPEQGQRNLLMGIAALQRERYGEAAELLGRAAKTYPLLGDYALYYQAVATGKAGRRADAVLILQALQKGYPDTPLLKKCLLLEADTVYESGAYAPAAAHYQKFIEKYPLGSDSLQASYRLASCNEQLGDVSGAAAIYRSLWLNSPGSVQAAKAEDNLKRLRAAGVPVKPYSGQELYKRATALSEQRRYDLALTTLRAINTLPEKRDFRDRVSLKIGQALLKSRQYRDAESSLKELAGTAASVAVSSEAAYLMARAVEKSGRDEDAFNAYGLVATVYPESAEADDALLDAAFIRKFQNRPKETARLLEQLLASYPKTGLKQRVVWETGWAHYRAGNSSAAAEQFKKVLTVDAYREKALFWYGRSLAATGDTAGAEASFTLLRKEFPYGFYTLVAQGGRNRDQGETRPLLAEFMPDMVPLPDGYERVKALISLGLGDDAATELAACRKKLAKSNGDAGLARLYLELGNYNRAMSLYDASLVQRDPENRQAWAFLYPKAFGDLVSKFSEKAGVAPSLAYAVMKAESAFVPTAKSPVGARGLMQLMPQTAAMVLHEKKIDPERLSDPELNIRLGTKHLRELIDKYNGNQIAVIASYNAGAHNVNRWLKTYANVKDEEFIESIPFAETRDYVKKVLSVAELYKRLYGMK